MKAIQAQKQVQSQKNMKKPNFLVIKSASILDELHGKLGQFYYSIFDEKKITPGWEKFCQ